jgi:hypothetical protein
MKGGMVAVWMLAAFLGTARAQQNIVLDEVLGSWQGDDDIQYVELRMLANDQNQLANVAALVFDDADGSEDGRRTAIFTQNVVRGIAEAKILVASQKLADLAGIQPNFLIPDGFLRPRNGRVCYAVATGNGFSPVDCVAYGKFTGTTGSFGAPTRLTPDNRVLRRVDLTGRNRRDWTSALDPVLENNAGGTGAPPATLCGDGIISQGEECDGDALGGATCESLGFAKGDLACFQCHYDTDGCTDCGNDQIDAKEECDGTDLGDRTCASLGYTGGALGCTKACKLTLDGCDPSFFVPGGGGAKSDCLGEWRIANGTGGPNTKGKVAARQTCKDGDASCDADATVDGTCTFTLDACFSRDDARLAKCPATAVSGWVLRGKADPATPSIAALIAAVAALGPSTVDGLAVTFSPALAEPDLCTEGVTMPVPARGKLVLKSQTLGPNGKPKDGDTLKLACRP